MLVKPRHGQDLVQVVDGLGVLDLNDGDDRLVGRAAKVRTFEVAVIGSPSWPVAANPIRRIAARGNG